MADTDEVGPAHVEKTAGATSVGERALKGAILLSARGLLIRAIGAVSGLVLARLLLPRDFGLLAFGYTLLAFGGLLTDAGIGAALVRGSREPEREDLSAVLGFQIAITLTVITVAVGVSVSLGSIASVTAVMISGLLPAAVRAPSWIVLERRLEYGLQAVTDLLDTGVYSVVALGLVLAGFGIWGVAVAAAIRAIPGTILLVRKGPVGLLRPTLNIARVRPILRFGVQYEAVGVVSLIRDEGLNVAILAISGLRVLGIIALANSLLQAVTIVFESLWRVSFPAMAQLMRDGTVPLKTFDRIAQMTAFATAVVVVAIVSIAPGSLSILLGTKWHSVLLVLPGMCAGLLLVGPVSVACAGYLAASGNARTILFSTVMHTVLAFAMLPLLPLLGVQGYGYMAAGTCLCEAIVLTRATHKRSGWNAFRSLLPSWVIAGVAGTAAWFAASWTSAGLAGSAVVLVGAETALVLLFVTFQPNLFAEIVRAVRGHLSL